MARAPKSNYGDGTSEAHQSSGYKYPASFYQPPVEDAAGNREPAPNPSPATADREYRMPASFTTEPVKAEDGTVDREATMAKANEAKNAVPETENKAAIPATENKGAVVDKSVKRPARKAATKKTAAKKATKRK